MIQVNNQAIELIKGFEGFVPHTYKDQVGVLTIGYGTIQYPNGDPVKEGDTCTEDQATNWLTQHIEDVAEQIGNWITKPLNDNQQAAILSCVYNIGTGGFHTSTLLRLINQNPSDPNIIDAFMMWDKGHVDGKLVVIDDLAKRRKKEAVVYFTPMN